MTPTELVFLVTTVVTGFTACAEFGSFAFVHPVIAKLPYREHLQVEQGLVRTFGRVMPVLMTASLLLLITAASVDALSHPFWQLAGIGVWALGLTSTILVNVGINARTGRWTPNEDSGEPGWRRMRRRWEIFQGIRASAFLAGYLAWCVVITLH